MKPLSLSSRRFYLQATLAALAVGVTTGCGFKLRGRLELPFQAIYINGPITVELRNQIAFWLQVSQVAIVDDPKKAQVMVEIVTEQNARQLLTYDKNSQPNSYRLISRIQFRVMTPQGVELLPEGDIYTIKDMDWSITNSPAYEAMATGFFNEMKKDLALQMMRRLEKIKSIPQPESGSN